MVFDVILCVVALGLVYMAFGLGHLRGEAVARAKMRRAQSGDGPFPEPGPGEGDDEDDGEPSEDDEDVCLRVGMHVLCQLSDRSHTHGVIIGFGISPNPSEPMLAMVDVGRGAPLMPIDVDSVEPVEPRAATYRSSQAPDKQWN